MSSFKLLGVILSQDLTWTAHCDYIVKKASRRLYALRQLRKCGVSTSDIVKVYCSLIRSILEYASVVFADLPEYLCNILEKVQKRALAIIFPDASYDQALAKADLTSLGSRRLESCSKFINNINLDNPLYGLISSLHVARVPTYSLRSGVRSVLKPVRTNRFANFITYKYGAQL